MKSLLSFPPYFGLSILLILVAVLPDSAFAQSSGILRAVGPWKEKAPPFNIFGGYRGEGSSRVRVKSQGTKFEYNQHKWNLFAPVWKDEDNEVGGIASVGVQDFHTDAFFHANRRPFPNDLWKISLGLSYRRHLGEQMVLGGNFVVGSDSDKPFSEGGVISVRGNLFFRYPLGEKNALLFFLNYSNTRSFAANIPLPGVGFWYEPSTWGWIILGIPFVIAEVNPIPALKGFKISASYFILRNVQGEISYSWKRFLKFYAKFQWQSDGYLLRDRPDEDDRLYYYEKRVTAGFSIGLYKYGTLEFFWGFHFDRFYFIGEDYDEKDDNRISLEDGHFIGGQLRFRF